jgi:hypothetical protein
LLLSGVAQLYGWCGINQSKYDARQLWRIAEGLGCAAATNNLALIDEQPQTLMKLQTAVDSRFSVSPANFAQSVIQVSSLCSPLFVKAFF